MPSLSLTALPDPGRLAAGPPGREAIVCLQGGLETWIDSPAQRTFWTGGPEGWRPDRSGRSGALFTRTGRSIRQSVGAVPGGLLLRTRCSEPQLARFVRWTLQVPGLSRVFDPEPSWTYQRESPAGEERRQDILDSPGRFGGDWIFTPPPFVFAVRGRAGWMAVGLEADPESLDFVSLRLGGTAPALDVTLDFGRRRSLTRPLPSLFVSRPESDPYAALARFFDRHPPPPGRVSGPVWWRRPIFCGWGEQIVLAKQSRPAGRPADQCRQEVYERFLEQLDIRELEPGTLTIDDKWCSTYGGLAPDPDRWPRMRAFVNRCHARGLRVVLWLPLWHPEGLPAAWCIQRDGKPYKADPRHPDYQRHLAERIRFLLSPQGFDADGLKVDWTNQGPWDLTDHEDEVWGVEMLRRYHAVVYRAARSAKAHALVITHTYHPAFVPWTDMLRLNDIMPWCPDVVDVMRHRARMARLIAPSTAVDTDNCSMPDRRQFLDYMAVQPELGVPSLYFLSRVDGNLESIRPEDWEEIRRTWQRYRERLEH